MRLQLHSETLLHAPPIDVGISGEGAVSVSGLVVRRIRTMEDELERMLQQVRRRARARSLARSLLHTGVGN